MLQDMRQKKIVNNERMVLEIENKNTRLTEIENNNRYSFIFNIPSDATRSTNSIIYSSAIYA